MKLLAPHLTEDNHIAVLDEASGRSKRQVEELVARLHPVPDLPHQKLRRAQELLRHAIPDGDPAAVFDRALTLLLEQLMRHKCATKRSHRGELVPERVADEERPASRCSGTRHIPAEVKRRVWERDQGRCTFVGTNGHRCTEQGRLEYHHLKPYADGGPATEENIVLACSAHNRYEAERVFGSLRL